MQPALHRVEFTILYSLKWDIASNVRSTLAKRVEDSQFVTSVAATSAYRAFL